MKIGKFKPKNRFFLAPMLEPNDIAFRLLCKKTSCGLTYTGMINPLSKQELYLEDKPALQIFCTDTKGLKEFIRKHESSVSLFDFNLGCPSTVASRLGFGSFLHNDLRKIEEILKTMRESTDKPITVKLRKSPKTIEIVKLVEKYVDAICIHPRTQKQGYSGEPDLEFAISVKNSTNLPVIYSGNVSEKNAKELLKKFDFVMIGRNAIGNPNIFSKLNGQSKQVTFGEYLKLSKKYKLYFRQIKYQAMCWTKNLKNAKKIREKLVSAKNVKDIEEVFKKI